MGQASPQEHMQTRYPLKRPTSSVLQAQTQGMIDHIYILYLHCVFKIRWAKKESGEVIAVGKWQGGLSFSKCGNEGAPSSVPLSLVPKQQTKIKSVEFISNLLPARLTMKTPVGARQIQQQKRRICRAMNLLQRRQPSQSVMFWISWNTPSF